MLQIDWNEMAVPQVSGVDTRNALRLAGNQFVGAVPPTILDGYVEIRELHHPYSLKMRSAPLDHPSIATAEAWLRTWPEGLVTVRTLVRRFCPVDLHGFEGRRGCMCGSLDRAGWILASVYDPVGLAEAWVHEAAHIKLRLLGVDFEQWDSTLIENEPQELYPSSIRKDKMRPMGAVLHGLYSYTYVTALGRAIGVDDSYDLNRKRILEGRDTVMRHALPTTAGMQFLTGLYDWVERITYAGVRSRPSVLGV